jgi:hypothetical protein
MMKETKDVVVLIAKIGNALGQSLEDKKFTWEDLVAFGPVLAAFPAALANISDLPAEFAAANDADREELANTFCTEFAITQAEAEVAVEKAIAVAVAVWNLIK